MKMTTKYSPIAIAVAALIAGPAMAAGPQSGGGYGYGHSPNKMVDHKTNIRTDIGYSDSSYENDTDVEVEKTYDTDRYINVVGTIDVEGVIDIDSSSASLTSQNQNNYKNKTINSMVDNNAEAVENGLQGASGNVGLNIAAGDHNAQDNSAALSKIDAAFVFAAADSISNQNAERNVYINHGTRNNAVLAGNTLRDATGNIAVNIAAGNSNLQANSLAASVNSNGNMAEATVSSQQTLDHNFTKNTGMLKRVSDTVDVAMEGSLQGSYNGTSDQSGDVYPDIWTGDTHPDGGQTGHFDLDDEAQGAVDLNGDGGAAALATILNYAYNFSFTESEVIEGMLKVSDPQQVQSKGFSLLDIKNYVETLGLRGRGYSVNPEILDRIKIPTIALLDIRGYKHFVVLKKTTQDKVYIADPALGNRVMDRQDFIDGWNKVTFAVIGEGFDRDSILLRPKQPLTARSTVDPFRPLSDAELLDFGFYRSELF